MAINDYPQDASRFGSQVRRGNFDPSRSDATYFMVEGVDIDFKVQSFLNSSSSPVTLYDGAKYVIGSSSSQPTAVTNKYTGTLVKGDVVVYDGGSDTFKLLYSANTDFRGLSGGYIVYAMTEKSFFGHDGTDWGPIGGGVTGATGNTGPAGLTGAPAGFKYVSDADTSLGIGGFTFTAVNGLTFHKQPNAGSADLSKLVFPSGTDEGASVVTFILTGANGSDQVILRAKPKAVALDGSILTINSAQSEHYEVLSNTIPDGDIFAPAGTNAFFTLVADGRTGAVGPEGLKGTTGATGGLGSINYTFEADSIGKSECMAKKEDQLIGTNTIVELAEIDADNNNHATLYSLGAHETALVRFELAEDPSRRYIEYIVKGSPTIVQEVGSDNVYIWKANNIEFVNRVGAWVPADLDSSKAKVFFVPLATGATGDTGTAGIDGITGATGANIGYPFILKGGATHTVGETNKRKFWRGNTGAADAAAVPNVFGYTYDTDLGQGASAGFIVYIDDSDTPSPGTTYGNVIQLSPYVLGPSSTSFLHQEFGYDMLDITNDITVKNRPGTLHIYKKDMVAAPPRYTVAGRYSFDRTALQLAKNNPAGIGLQIRLLGVTGAEIFDGFDDFSDRRLVEDDFVQISISLDGVTGPGITFGGVVDNKLFLDYVDAFGNTFGRFDSGIRGITGASGPTGGINPFNILYGVTASSSSATVINPATPNGTLFYQHGILSEREIVVNDVSLDGINYEGYISQASDGVNTGYITIFEEDSLNNFGLFQYERAVDSAVGGNNFTRFKNCVHRAGNINFTGSSSSGAANTFAEGTRVRFAINQDGQIGNTGFGIGFTYGNEYFAQAGRPTNRGDGASLEIGDKWFSTTTGLEFTFLGANDDGIVLGGDEKGADIRWVQTNSGRRGRQGPQGAPGTPGVLGTTGPTGATGVNHVGDWESSRTYLVGDTVYYDFLTMLAPSGQNWADQTPPNAVNGYFRAKTRNNASAPFSIKPEINWDPVSFGIRGVTGAGVQGVTGSTGAGYTAAAINDDGELTFRVIPVGWDGDPSEGSLPLLNLGVVVGQTGATGATGPIGGVENQFMYRIDEESIGGTPALARDATSGQIQIGYYREIPKSSEAALGSNSLLLNALDGPIQYVSLDPGEAINTVLLDNTFVNDGTSVTVYLRNPSSGDLPKWNANSKADFTHSSGTVSDVFFSDNGSVAAGITLAQQNGATTVINFMSLSVGNLDSSGEREIYVNMIPFYKMPDTDSEP